MLDYVLVEIGSYEITPKVIFVALAFVVATRALAFALGRFLLKPFFRRNNVDIGRSYAVTRIARYVVYVIGVYLGLSFLEIQVQAVWAGAAALLVGIGIGLQQTFNDFFSGFLLLLEGPVEVGNVIEVDGIVGRVVEIGLRTSKVRTRDDIMIIVPNSHMVNSNIINWSHNRRPLRFQVDVGVAYGSPPARVSELLVAAAEAHEEVLPRPAPRVVLRGFGASSLDFTLYFYTHENWRIEFVKSDLRLAIVEALREAQIQIPFPQQDLWVRNGEALAGAFRQNAARDNDRAAPTPVEAGDLPRQIGAPADGPEPADPPAQRGHRTSRIERALRGERRSPLEVGSRAVPPGTLPPHPGDPSAR